MLIARRPAFAARGRSVASDDELARRDGRVSRCDPAGRRTSARPHQRREQPVLHPHPGAPEVGGGDGLPGSDLVGGHERPRRPRARGAARRSEDHAEQPGDDHHQVTGREAADEPCAGRAPTGPSLPRSAAPPWPRALPCRIRGYVRFGRSVTMHYLPESSQARRNRTFNRHYAMSECDKRARPLKAASDGGSSVHFAPNARSRPAERLPTGAHHRDGGGAPPGARGVPAADGARGPHPLPPLPRRAGHALPPRRAAGLARCAPRAPISRRRPAAAQVCAHPRVGQE